MSRAVSRLAVVLLAAGTFLVPAGSAEAAWSVHGTGSGKGKAVTLAAPTNVTLTCSVLTTPKATWTASPNATGYEVWRAVGNGAAGIISSGVSTTNFTDSLSGLSLTSVTYSVKAKLQNWRSSSAPGAPITVTLAGLCLL